MWAQLQAQALSRKPHPSHVSDDEWAFVAPYLTLMRVDAPQRTHDLRDVFNATRWLVKTGAPWRYMPNHFPPWPAVYQQMQRWSAAGAFEAMVHDLRALMRLAQGRTAEPSAVVLDGQTLQSTPERGHRATYDGHKRNKGSRSTSRSTRWATCSPSTSRRAANRSGRRSRRWWSRCRWSPGGEVELAYVDQGYTGEAPATAAAAHGIVLEVVRLSEAKKGSVLLPRRWVVERSFAWLTRFRRLARDFERLATTRPACTTLPSLGLLLSKTAQLVLCKSITASSRPRMELNSPDLARRFP